METVVCRSVSVTPVGVEALAGSARLKALLRSPREGLVFRRGLLATLALPEVVQQHGARRDVLRVGDDDAVVANDEADIGLVFEPLGRSAERDGPSEPGCHRAAAKVVVLLRSENVHFRNELAHILEHVVKWGFFKLELNRCIEGLSYLLGHRARDGRPNDLAGVDVPQTYDSVHVDRLIGYPE